MAKRNSEGQIYYEIEIEKIDIAIISGSGRNHLSEEIMLEGRLCNTNSQKAQKDMPVRFTFSSSDKNGPDVFGIGKFADKEGNKQKCLSGYCYVLHSIFNNVLQVFLNYKNKLYLRLDGNEFVRSNTDVLCWMLTFSIDEY